VTAVTADERRSALAVAAALSLAAMAVAATVRAGWPAETRRLLGFGFTGVPARFDTAVAIFAGNARLLAAIFAAILVAQSPWLAGREARRGPLLSVLTAAVDTVLTLSVAVNVALVGAALGAYGQRMVVAVLPHGPLELAAYALALAVYLRARREPIAARHVIAVAALCLGGLAVAALLETFAVP
jgi:Stage II sporulation protein M